MQVPSGQARQAGHDRHKHERHLPKKAFQTLNMLESNRPAMF